MSNVDDFIAERCGKPSSSCVTLEDILHLLSLTPFRRHETISCESGGLILVLNYYEGRGNKSLGSWKFKKPFNEQEKHTKLEIAQFLGYNSYKRYCNCGVEWFSEYCIHDEDKGYQMCTCVRVAPKGECSCEHYKF